jgi:hypothetical protein
VSPKPGLTAPWMHAHHGPDGDDDDADDLPFIDVPWYSANMLWRPYRLERDTVRYGGDMAPEEGTPRQPPSAGVHGTDDDGGEDGAAVALTGRRQRERRRGGRGGRGVASRVRGTPVLDSAGNGFGYDVGPDAGPGGPQPWLRWCAMVTRRGGNNTSRLRRNTDDYGYETTSALFVQAALAAWVVLVYGALVAAVALVLQFQGRAQFAWCVRAAF